MNISGILKLLILFDSVFPFFRIYFKEIIKHLDNDLSLRMLVEKGFTKPFPISTRKFDLQLPVNQMRGQVKYATTSQHNFIVKQTCKWYLD